jgi:hypothetical protein
MDQVGLDVGHESGETVLDLPVQESAQKLPSHGSRQPTRVAGNSPGENSVDLLVVLGEKWTINVVMPVKDRDLVSLAKCLGQVLGIDFHTAQRVGREFVRKQ